MAARRLILAVTILCAASLTTVAWSQSTASKGAALFSSYDVMALRLEAPLNDLFSHAGREDDYSVLGTLGYTAGGQERNIENVEVSLRGHTSLAATECTFPKLKLRFSSASATDGTPFSGAASLKIGTHCGESTDDSVTAKYGRLASEASPHREAFVYRLLDTLGIATLKARPARITYVYTDAKDGQTPDQKQPLARNAMLLENDDAMVERLGGVRQIEEAAFTNARDQFAPADTIAVALAEAMIGNFDWCLKMTPRDAYRCNARHPLWNIIAVVDQSGRARPAPYDFDVSGIVAGKHRWFADVYNEAFVPSRSHPVVEVLGQVQRTRTLFARPDLDAVRARFVERKSNVYAALSAATMDAAGKQVAKQYLDGFFDAIGSDEAFYRPAVVAPNTVPYGDSGRTKPVCAARGAIPIGTIVSEPAATEGQMIQVTLLDVTWHWGPPTKCPAVHQSSVWIDSSAVSREYPPATAKPSAAVRP
jgi:hypothetical protein